MTFDQWFKLHDKTLAEDLQREAWNAALDAAAAECQRHYDHYIDWCRRFPNGCNSAHGAAGAADLCRLDAISLKVPTL